MDNDNMDKFEVALKVTEKIFKEIEAEPGYKEEAERFDRIYAVAKALHEARKHAKLSQKELANKLKTTQSVISRMESGRANISYDKLCDYAKACGGRLKIQFEF